MKLEVRKAQLSDLERLHQICIDAYSQNFAHHWQEGGLAWYLDQQFDQGQLAHAIESIRTDYYIIYRDNQSVGFCKLGYSDETKPTENWLELEKIYVLPNQKGNGIGKTALDFVVDVAKQKGRKELILYVIDTNQSAIHFYQKNGFSFAEKIRLELPYFKEELKGAWKMVKRL